MQKLILIKKIIKFMGAYKWHYLISLFGVAIASGIRGGVFSIIYKNTFDASITRNPLNKLILYMIVLLCISCLQRYLNFRFKVYNRQISANIRRQIYEKLLKADLLQLERTHSASIQSCINNDIPALEGVYSIQMSNFVNTTIIGIISIIIVMLLDYRLALVSIVINVIGSVINMRFIPHLKKNNKVKLETLSKLLKLISSTIYGNKEIKLFSIRKKLYKKFSDLNIENGRVIVKESKISGVIDGIQFFIKSLNFTGVLLIGLYLLTQEKITVGVIVAIIVQQEAIAFMFSNLNNCVNELQKSLIAAERVFNLLNMKEEVQDKLLEVDINPQKEFIEFNNVHFKYKEHNVLIDLNFKVKKNSVVTIIGDSGSGKSTLLKLLMSFYRLESGKIYVEGRDIRLYNKEDLRNKTSYISQESFLFYGSIQENIRFGSLKNDVSKDDIVNASKKSGAHDFIVKLPDGYDTIIDENGNNFSGGEKQRIAIARAFIKNAPILLLDEPTAALDKSAEEIVKQSLQMLMADRTVIIVTHKLSSIENMKNIYKMDNGSLVKTNI